MTDTRDDEHDWLDKVLELHRFGHESTQPFGEWFPDEKVRHVKAKYIILAWHNRQLEQAVRETEWRERIKSVKYVQEMLDCSGKLTCSKHKTHEIPELIKILELKQQEQAK